jgi:beta-galactosidase
VHVPKIHVVFDGLFVPTNQTTGDVITPSVEISSSSFSARVRFSLLDKDNSVIASNASNSSLSLTDTTIVDDVILQAHNIDVWSIQTPNLYTVRVEVFSNNGDVDTVETRVGFRTIKFDGETGFRLNNHPIKLRGFSHHNSIGGLGVSIPDRLWLFKIQMSVALGSNFWRMSHNPYRSGLYDLLDATGQMSWDENRDYGAKYANGAYVEAMQTMVKHHRNHASIVMYSFCNEYEW